MNKGRNRGLQIVSSLIMVLFVFYFASTSLFYHSHEVDGKIISHSHPYSQNESKPFHQHSKSEFHFVCGQSTLDLLFVVPNNFHDLKITFDEFVVLYNEPVIFLINNFLHKYSVCDPPSVYAV